MLQEDKPLMTYGFNNGPWLSVHAVANRTPSMLKLVLRKLPAPSTDPDYTAAVGVCLRHSYIHNGCGKSRKN
jgi:hypothetical protein